MAFNYSLDSVPLHFKHLHGSNGQSRVTTQLAGRSVVYVTPCTIGCVHLESTLALGSVHLVNAQSVRSYLDPLTRPHQLTLIYCLPLVIAPSALYSMLVCAASLILQLSLSYFLSFPPSIASLCQ